MQRNEAIELLKIYQEDFFYRHTILWNLFYKTMFAILGLLSLPYFVKDMTNNWYIFLLFPALSIFVSVYSKGLMNGEIVRMRASRKRIDILKEEHLEEYINIDINIVLDEYPEKQRRKLSKRVTDKLINSYRLLIIFAIAEIIILCIINLNIL